VALTIDPVKWRGRRGMKRLLAALGGKEGLTRYVGGAVRDDLLDLPVSDVDLATRLEPAEVVRRLEAAKIKAVPTGIDHGTVTAVSDGHPYEVTTLRRDVETDGRRATVAFTSEWEEDAARRDFTINALFADPRTGEVFDYFGGLDDLADRHVRFIGDPLKRIAEDHLRILRYFRFHARFGAGEPDEAALDACTERANDLMGLSRERIADELLKLLAFADPAPTVRIMVGHGILRPILPEITPDRLSDLVALIAAEQAAGIVPDGLRRLAALLPSRRRFRRRAAQALQQGAKAARLCGRPPGRFVARGPGLPPRQRLRGRPPPARRTRRRCRAGRRLAAAAAADRRRRLDRTRAPRGADRRAHTKDHREPLGRGGLSRRRQVRRHRQRGIGGSAALAADLARPPDLFDRARPDLFSSLLRRADLQQILP
jgi:poly(A) polymerase